MKKPMLSLAAAAAAVAGLMLWPQPTVRAQSIAERSDWDKVTICHYPPGNPDNVQVITVDISALPAHLAHGDGIYPYCSGTPQT